MPITNYKKAILHFVPNLDKYVDDRPAYIYALIDPENGLVKYIGKTINLKKRYSNHCSLYQNSKNTYKCNWLRGLLKNNLLPEMVVIDYMKESESSFWEQHYISLYKSWGFKLTNLTSGGESCFRFSLQTIQKIKFTSIGKNKGKIHSKETCERQSKAQLLRGKNQYRSPSAKINIAKANIDRSKKVLQFDLNKKLIKEWISLSDPAKEYNSSEKTIRNAIKPYTKNYTAHGYIWRFKNECKITDNKLQEEVHINHTHHPKYRKK